MADHPSIVIFGHSAKPSGAEIAMLSLAEGLRTYVPVIVLCEHGPIAIRAEGAGIDTLIVPLPERILLARRTNLLRHMTGLTAALAFLRYLRQIRAAIDRIGPSVVVANTMKAHVIIAAAYPFGGPPIIFYVRDHLSRDTFSRFSLSLLRVILRLRGKAVVANSTETLALIPSNRRQTLRAALPSPIQMPPSSLVDQVGEQVHRQPSVFGIAGRLTSWKGQALLIEAFAQAFPGGCERLELAGGTHFGEESYEADLRELCARLNLAERVTFLGHVDEVYTTIARWDCLVHSSIVPEPFGQVVAQGMALGLPVIASREGGPVAILDSYVGAVFFNPRECESLAEALREVTRSPNKVRRDAHRMGPQLAERYSPNVVGPQFEQLVSGYLQPDHKES